MRYVPGHRSSGRCRGSIERASVKDGLLCYAVYQPLPDVERAFNENSRTGGQRVDFTPERLAELQETTRLSTRLALAVPSQSFAMAVLGVREALRLWIDRRPQGRRRPREASPFTIDCTSMVRWREARRPGRTGVVPAMLPRHGSRPLNYP